MTTDIPGETFDEMVENERFLKRLVVDAICGVGFPSPLLAAECVSAGMAVDAGNQWNARYVWRRERLLRCRIEQLQELYQGLCEARDENTTSPIDEACTSSGLILQ
jgi:hypothetical protein